MSTILEFALGLFCRILSFTLVKKSILCGVDFELSSSVRTSAPSAMPPFPNSTALGEITLPLKEAQEEREPDALFERLRGQAKGIVVEGRGPFALSLSAHHELWSLGLSCFKGGLGDLEGGEVGR